MNQFLNRVYNTTGLSIFGALSTSYLAAASPLIMANMSAVAIFGLISTLGGYISASYMKTTTVEEIKDGATIYTTKNSPLRLGLFGLGTVGLGLGALPLFTMAAAINPSILPTAIGLTSAIFGGASLVAYKMPKDKMLGYGGVLFGSLLGLIGLQLVGLLSAIFMGPTPFSTLLFSANNYLGIGLFSIFIAYDTHLAIKMYELKQADHLGMSIQFILDFWNILVRLVSILSRRE
eukprot:GHVR01000020.1.p1 GENE.GHVR01000020.1~~GHVR01000020.1.p1  ORF type:complete len:234 (+),score=3.03 GHVR01000020.1:1314-2015(+)